MFPVQNRHEVEERKEVYYKLIALCAVRKRERNDREQVILFIVPKCKLESEEISYNTVESRGELISDGRPACKRLLHRL